VVSFQDVRDLSKGIEGGHYGMGHPILANPKEPLNVSPSFRFSVLPSWRKRIIQAEELTCVVCGISAARRQLGFPWDGPFGSLSSSAAPGASPGYYLSVEEFDVGQSRRLR